MSENQVHNINKKRKSKIVRTMQQTDIPKNTLPNKKRILNRARTLQVDTQKILPSQPKTSIAFDTEGVQYNRTISIDQVIEFKLRSQKRHSTAKLSTNELKVIHGYLFSDEFYEAIENFLDKHGLFIVDPTPSRSPIKYSKLIKVTTSSFNSPLGGEPFTPCSVKLPALSKFAKVTSNDTNSPVPYPRDPMSADVQKKPFLGKVCTSSLFKKRRKFETMDETRSSQKLIDDQENL